MQRKFLKHLSELFNIGEFVNASKYIKKNRFNSGDHKIINLQQGSGKILPVTNTTVLNASTLTISDHF